jgi:putative acyl-CoA dehydrogenase
MAVWEGSGNVIALDVLRALAREPESFDAFDAELGLAAGASAVFDEHLAATRRLVRSVTASETDAASRQARRLVAELALSLQASLLLRTAPSAISDAFIDSRLGSDRAHLYGELSDSADLAAIIARA